MNTTKKTGRPKTLPDSVQVSVRIPKVMLENIMEIERNYGESFNALIPEDTFTHVPKTKSDLIRIIFARGMKVWLKEMKELTSDGIFYFLFLGLVMKKLGIPKDIPIHELMEVMAREENKEIIAEIKANVDGIKGHKAPSKT